VRAAVWEGPGEMRLGELPDPGCPLDGALVRVTACGICGTDVRAFYNGDRRIEPGAVLGHEICGEVLELGPDAEPVQFSPGFADHVTDWELNEYLELY
jgi:L-iditol 2-dehydrogenase